MPELRVIHNLPPSWDGRTVEWRGWVSRPTTMRLHAPRERCEQCGSAKGAAVNVGVVAPAEGEMVEVPVTRTGRSGRRFDYGTKMVPAWPVVRLAAFRCPDCQVDTVWDRKTDEWWTLDETDYGVVGSTDPRLF